VTGARPWLLAAAWMSVAASILHLAVIIGGPDWYRFFGAAEEMARAAERGSPVPTILTVVIAAILGGWAIYAFGAAGVIRRWPLMRTALFAITTVLLARSLLAFVPAAWAPEHTIAFRIWSSAICFVMGACFAVGLSLAWPDLSKRRPNGMVQAK
jgi:hypothetical protein